MAIVINVSAFKCFDYWSKFRFTFHSIACVSFRGYVLLWKARYTAELAATSTSMVVIYSIIRNVSVVKYPYTIRLILDDVSLFTSRRLDSCHPVRADLGFRNAS